MFERFTDRARRAVVLAQEEARLLQHDYIGTEHLLLGLIHEGEGLAAQALAKVGLTLDGVRAEVEKRIGRGTVVPSGHIPFTPRAKKVLELSLRQALQLGHDYIGTEHILLGLLREAEGVAAQILITDVEGGLERLHDELSALLILSGSASKPHLMRLRRDISSRVSLAGVPMASVRMMDDEVRKRLEAIEARLSAIERLLRDQRGEEEVS